MQVAPRQTCQRDTTLARATCLECRSSHIRCDAQKPKCGRCSRINHECHYLKSRRGCKAKEKRNHFHEGDVLSFDGTSTEIDDLISLRPTVPTKSGDIDMEFTMISSPTTPSDSYTSPTNHPRPSIQFSDHLIDLYYSQFHPAHPILLPHRTIYALEFSEYPQYLKNIIFFVGAHYSPHCSPEDYKWSPELRQPNSVPKTVHGVQALLLLAIALHARDEQDVATELLDNAIEIAIEISMHKASSAVYSNENSLVVESYRRTWWELYVVDGLFAMFHQSESYACCNVRSDVGLPCEESIYDQYDVLPPSNTLDQLYNRIFSDEEIEFSSFAYRIDAAKLLGSVLSLDRDLTGCRSGILDQLDASLVSWFYNLSPSKRLLDNRGKVDEMLFQAHMIVHLCTIHLHRPQSDLTAVRLDGTSCTRQPITERASTKQSIHTAKALQAANDLSQLATLQAPIISHTPFFTCAIALSSIVQLSAYSLRRPTQCEELVREQVNLAIGVLKAMGETWRVAVNVGQRVKLIARRVLEQETESHHGRIEREDPLDLRNLIDYGSWTADLLGQEEPTTDDGMGLSPL